MVGQRSTMHLVYRLGVRPFSMRALAPQVSPASLGLRLGLGASMDVGVWWLLRRSDRLFIGARLGLDLVDQVVWGGSVPDTPEAAMLSSVPLALEAGARCPRWAPVLPIVQLGAVAAYRRRRGLPTPPAALLGPAMAMVFGELLARYEQHQRSALLHDFESRLGAATGEAAVTGQMAVAMAADSVVDDVARTEYVISAYNGDTQVGTARALADWKAKLSDAATRNSVYLGVHLLQWQRSNNGPRLADNIDLQVDPEAGLVILSPEQAAWLSTRLAELELRGTVPVVLLKPVGGHLAGSPLGLRIGPLVVVIPPDSAPGPKHYDPSPLAVLAGALWCLSLSSAGHGKVPLSRTLPCALASVALAGVADKVVGASSTLTSADLLGPTMALGVAQGLATTGAMRVSMDPGGTEVFPGLQSLLAPAAMYGLHRGRLGASRRRRLDALMVAGLVVGIAARRPRTWFGPLAGLIEIGVVHLAFRSASQAISGAYDELSAELAGDWHVQMARAHQAGRGEVVDLVNRAIDGLTASILRLESSLPAATRDDLLGHLDAARERLESIR